jgi:hypothetical protein
MDFTRFITYTIWERLMSLYRWHPQRLQARVTGGETLHGQQPGDARAARAAPGARASRPGVRADSHGARAVCGLEMRSSGRAAASGRSVWERGPVVRCVRRGAGPPARATSRRGWVLAQQFYSRPLQPRLALNFWTEVHQAVNRKVVDLTTLYRFHKSS